MLGYELEMYLQMANQLEVWSSKYIFHNFKYVQRLLPVGSYNIPRLRTSASSPPPSRYPDTFIFRPHVNKYVLLRYYLD